MSQDEIHADDPADLAPVASDSAHEAATEPAPPATAEAEEAPPAPQDASGADSDAQEAAPRRTGLSIAFALVGFGLVAVLAMQAYLLISANSTSDQVESLEVAMTDLSDDLARVEGSVADVGTQVAEIETAPAASSSASDGPPPAALEAGFLPRYEAGQQDTALGLPLATIEGDEYYSDAPASIDPADGTRRVWLVWAHWCPHCQAELPELSAWWAENGGTYDNIEMVSVTTSIDPSRGNPLEGYLDELQLPFATLVDHDLTMAAQLGTSAFPFWVVTDGDGTVLFRTAGRIPIEQVEAIVTQLEELPA